MKHVVKTMNKPASKLHASACTQHPVFELLARYRAVFGAAWGMRRELVGPRRLTDEAAFLPAALSLRDTPIHPAPRRLAFAMMALFGIALIWASIGEVDIVAIARGRVVVSERTKLIQPLQTSIVQEVLVKDGDRVVAGQPLVALDPTSATADKFSILEQYKAAQSESLRTQLLLAALKGQSATLPTSRDFFPKEWTKTELRSATAQLDAEWGEIQAKLSRFRSELARRQAETETARAIMAKLEATLPLSRQREEDFQKLALQGFMASHAGQDRQRERIELERDLDTQRARLYEASASSAESENAKAAYLAETLRSLHERLARADLTREQTLQEQLKAVQREKITTLLAPVAGMVQQLAVHTQGGVVTDAQVLMVIVPDSAGLRAEVTLDNKDIGFVHLGQQAEIKFDTFNFTRYGTVDAEVQMVTADAVSDEKLGAVFPVALRLHRETIDVDGSPVRLSAGMNITAEIKTGKRKVIEYLFSPVQRATRESLRER
ncbi:HlyD family type I secretion periplasmic adaptor subunit [Pseudorhodoferax sp. Leaf265]|uniref:HlyD family type I secretion periplasmic adaptor subunit n=1 Tax=Pseudorhodoferax sp. Leaf265 TaxID=1736315 RepID=UPI000A50C889|nr:HlyD family type I secretion periplasmic adaptor subunit [Pseudorhodoferax sp. Leaf265]